MEDAFVLNTRKMMNREDRELVVLPCTFGYKPTQMVPESGRLLGGLLEPVLITSSERPDSGQKAPIPFGQIRLEKTPQNLPAMVSLAARHTMPSARLLESIPPAVKDNPPNSRI
jgi:hypothetical protein